MHLKMKLIDLKLAVIYFFLLPVYAGCARFEPATCEITSCTTEGKMLTATAVVTDDGGAGYFAEQGFCYSKYDTLSATDIYTTTVPLHYSTDSLTFSWVYEMPKADTIYFIRAYVKNNAGTAYSNIEKISTGTPDTNTNTLK